MKEGEAEAEAGGETKARVEGGADLQRAVASRQVRDRDGANTIAARARRTKREPQLGLAAHRSAAQRAEEEAERIQPLSNHGTKTTSRRLRQTDASVTLENQKCRNSIRVRKRHVVHVPAPKLTQFVLLVRNPRSSASCCSAAYLARLNK